MRARYLLIALLAFPAFAMDAQEQLIDAAAEARARDLFKQIRCVVCEAESIDESTALLAADMRPFVRRAVEAGQGDDVILVSLQQRYGDKVLMMPPVRGDTILLWVLPFMLILIGGLVWWRGGKR